MAYRFKLTEPYEAGFRRIAREQIERAQSELARPGDQAVAVHETRKALKRVRALLRLMRPAMGDPSFHAENAYLRETAGLLAGARDRFVLLETVTKLESAASLGSEGAGEAVRHVLQAVNGEGTPAVDAAAMKQAHTRLAEAKKRFARLRLMGKGFEVIGAGLEMSYRQTRRAFRAAYIELTDEAFHEWRKGTQQHWRHMVLLSRAWGECLAVRIDEARGLSQLLGDDHDLALLIDFVRHEPADRISAEQGQVIEKVARQRQHELRSFARPRGARLFAEGAKALHRRIALYWDSAVALKDLEPKEEEPPEPKKAVRAPAKRRRAAAARP